MYGLVLGLVLGAALSDGHAPTRGISKSALHLRSQTRMLEGRSLSSLEPVGTAAFLAAEVREHLDREWIKQECHERIAAVCADVYLGSVAPAAGASAPPPLDSGTLLIAIADALIASSAASDLFDEAFVGPYDVANLCSDLLLHRLGVGAECACNVVPTGVGDLAAAEALRARDGSGGGGGGT